MKKISMILLITVLAFASVFAGAEKDKSLVLTMGDNIPDRQNGYGAVFERINAEFIAAHPGLQITTESYQDQPWQEKVLIYATANQLPDVMKYWTFPAMMEPLIDAGMLAPMNKADFANFGYMAGALESSEFDGKLYGIPASADMWVVFINKSLFQKAGVAIPETWEDIKASVPAFRAIGVTPVVTNGREGWPLAETFDCFAQRINGDFTRVDKALKRTAKYTDPDFVQAAAYFQDLVKAGVFQEDLSTSDYDAARNMFGQERAAMYVMGSWEMAMATDMNFSQNFRDNLDVIKFPLIEGGKANVDDLLAWYGGNFIVSTGDNQELAYEYIKFFAERFADYAWEIQACFPAQAVTPLATDTLVSKKLIQIAAAARTTGGTPGLDRSDSVFKEDHQNLIRELCAGLITPQQFCERLDASAARAWDAAN